MGEWEKSVLLTYEREMLGLYVCDHPLFGVEHVLAGAVDLPVSGLSECDDGRTVVVGGILSSVTRKMTKQGNPWALVVLEDLEGAVEVLFFPQTYVNAAVHLVEDAVVLVRGRVDTREDVPKIIANEITVPDLSVGPRGPVVVSLPDPALHPAGRRALQGGAGRPPRDDRRAPAARRRRQDDARAAGRPAAGHRDARAVRRPQGAARHRLPAGRRLIAASGGRRAASVAAVERVIRPAARSREEDPTVGELRLCGGTLVVEQPDQVLLDYLDVRNGYAYPAYDNLLTNGTPALVDGDLLAPALIGVHMDAGRFGLLREMLPALEAVADLPAVPLHEADEDHILCVAGLFGILDEPRYAGRGVRGTVVSKVLHRKRPDLVPLYDSRIFEAYTAPGVLPRSTDRAWADFIFDLCRQMRDDLQAEAPAFDALEALAAEEGNAVSRLRILDILVWRTADLWH